MAITIGNSSIKGIYVGDSKVKAVYLGDNLVYGGENQNEDVSGLTCAITYTYNIPESGELVVPELYHNYQTPTTDYKVIIESNDGQKIQASVYIQELPIAIRTDTYDQYFISIDYINFENILDMNSAFSRCINLESVNFNGYGNYGNEPNSSNMFSNKCTSLNKITAILCYEEAVINIANSLPERSENDGIMLIGNHITISNIPVVNGWTYKTQ